MRHQIEQAKSAGITGFIVSWKDTPLNDQRLELLMRWLPRSTSSSP